MIAILVLAIMLLMGLAFAIMAQTEHSIAVNEQDQAQPLYAAEGAVRIVKNWFDDPNPSTGYLLPTASQVDRTLRYVDDDGDGTFQAYSSAPFPWNVVYRSGTNDLFEKPYRGSPAWSLEGTEDHPDLRISSTGSSAEQAFLLTLNNTLFPAFPSVRERALVTQIDVYGPPVLVVGGNRVRYGIATVSVTVTLIDNFGTGSETMVGQRVVKAVLNEAPYPGPDGPLKSCMDIEANGNFAPHWGRVTATNDLDLHSNLNSKVDSSVPWYNKDRIIARDMNLDGTLAVGSPGSPTADDQNGNGTLDFDEWLSSGSIEDPWLAFWAEGDLTAGGGAISPGCSTPDCQPAPWYRVGTNTLTMSNDHSNLVKNVSITTCAEFDYNLWKSIALTGFQNVHYFAYDSGSGLFRENGTGSPISFRTATDGQNGLFFFDTTDGIAPHDDDADGLYDNLTPAISLNGGGYQIAGFTYINATDFSTTGNGNAVTQNYLIAPAEPYIDANGNHRYDPDEYFVDLNYPGTPTGNWHQNGMYRVVDGYTRQDPAKDVSNSGKWLADINFYGVFYTNGHYNAEGNWTYFGSVIAKQGMDGNGSGGTPDIFFDERLIKGNWPPPELQLPRTIITSWETDM